MNRRRIIPPVPVVLSDEQAREQPLINRDTYMEVRMLRATEKMHDGLNQFYQGQAQGKKVELQ